MEKKLDGNYTRMLWAILNKSWRQHPTKQQVYGHLLPILKTIQIRWTRHVGHCWRSKDELISDILLWIPSREWAKAGWPARSYIQQLYADTGCSLEDLPGAMDDRDGWWERVREIHAGNLTWWWWWWWRIVTWNYNCQKRIIISYLKLYNCLKCLKLYNCIQIISVREEYMKPYNYVQTIR